MKYFPVHIKLKDKRSTVASFLLESNDELYRETLKTLVHREIDRVPELLKMTKHMKFDIYLKSAKGYDCEDDALEALCEEAESLKASGALMEISLH